jgi:pseudaminic acid synthase
MKIETEIIISNRRIGSRQPTYIVAEMSANHNQDWDQAVKIVETAKKAGADAVKLQTYTPDTLTINCNNKYFNIKGTLWHGKNLYKLYGKAYTPWKWQPKLKAIAENLSMHLFSTPFDTTAVDFLEKMDVPAYKIASFEMVDLPLIRRVAQTGKPIIMSTGLATLAEIDEAVRTIREAGGKQLALLKCTSSYPAPPEETNLRTILHMADAFKVPTGLSDHTIGIAVPIAAVALGACIVEKHFTLSRSIPGPDSSFSLEPNEFKNMVDAIRVAEKALGKINYNVTKGEAASRVFRRSLFVVKDIKAGEKFTKENVRSIRPGYGLHTRYWNDVLQQRASRDIKRGTPLDLGMMQEDK